MQEEAVYNGEEMLLDDRSKFLLVVVDCQQPQHHSDQLQSACVFLQLLCFPHFLLSFYRFPFFLSLIFPIFLSLLFLLFRSLLFSFIFYPSYLLNLFCQFPLHYFLEKYSPIWQLFSGTVD
jgi:hypothetical protein